MYVGFIFKVLIKFATFNFDVVGSSKSKTNAFTLETFPLTFEGYLCSFKKLFSSSLKLLIVKYILFWLFAYKILDRFLWNE